MPSPLARTDIFYTSEDGLRLHAAIYGEDHQGRWPVVCLPGLTRNARDFHELATHLAQDAPIPRRVIAFDYRGRGLSERDRNWRNYDVVVEARDILAGLIACGVDRAAFVGTSRGGLITMALGVMRPSVIKAAVLNDIGPVVSAEGLALIRTALERAPRPRSFEEAVTIQKSASGQSFGALMDADWERMVRAFYREEKRGYAPDFDRRMLKSLRGFSIGEPLPELWPQFMALSSVPIFVVRGGNSRLLTADTLEEMAKRHPNMQSVTIEGQGHAPLLETGGLPTMIAAFIDRAEKRAATSN